MRVLAGNIFWQTWLSVVQNEDNPIQKNVMCKTIKIPQMQMRSKLSQKLIESQTPMTCNFSDLLLYQFFLISKSNWFEISIYLNYNLFFSLAFRMCSVINFGPRLFDYINRMIAFSVDFHVGVFSQEDHWNLITLATITLSTFYHCYLVLF